MTVALRRRADCLEVSIADTGIGIAQEDQRRVSGLGLSIAKKVVEMHGGSIAVRSQAGMGTAFTVELPALEKKTDQEVRPT